MFKLKKILNSRTNAPEITTVEIASEMPYHANCVYGFDGGFITNIQESELWFVPIESYPGDESSYTIRGFIVTPDMFFEVPCYTEEIDVYVGTVLDLAEEDEHFVAVSDNGLAKNKVVVTDTSQYEEKQIVTVKFIK